MNFYFIKDQYFLDYPDINLMGNKEKVNGEEHGRPCFYALEDLSNGIYWVVPISSKVSKYKKIHEDKIKKFGECDTIVFGHVLGKERAFLLQNMCPITNDYIENVYINTSTGKPVVITPKLHAVLSKKARKLLTLLRNGKKLIFPDVSNIENALITRIKAEKEAAAIVID